MNDIKISVIVPVYKTEKYIHQCINSITAQTYRNLEIILVDDGSPDNCGKICDEYAAVDSRIKVIHKPNGGLVSARKAGVFEASGDYITFIDSDDWIDEGAYRHAADIIAGDNVDVFIFGFKKIYESSVSCEHENFSEGYFDRELMYNEICRINADDIFYKKVVSPFCWNKVIISEIVKDNISAVDNSAKVGEDASLMYPCLFDSSSVYVTYEPYYNYRMNNASMIHSFDPERYKTVEAVISRIQNSIIKHGLEKNEVITRQFRLYTFDLMLISDTSHYINSIRELYPEIRDNSRVLFYGKGVFAQNLKFLAEKDNLIEVSGFIDSSSINEIDNYEFDYVIIAVTIAQFVEEILATLYKSKIDNTKILYLKSDYVFSLAKDKISIKDDE